MAYIVPDNGIGQLFNPVPADLAIYGRSSLVSRIKGRSHIYTDQVDGVTKWYDYVPRAPLSHPVVGQVLIATDAAFAGKKVAAFTDGTYIDMGNIWPVDSDFTLIMVMKRSTMNRQMALFGGVYAGGDYHGLLLGADGRLSYTHLKGGQGISYDGAPGQQNGPALDLTKPHVIAASWNSAAKRLLLTVDGAQYDDPFAPGSADNKIAAMYIGRLAGTPLDFVGQIAEAIVFKEDVIGNDLATINTFLKGEYGIA